MAVNWEIKGEYMEACSCDFLCPCITKNATLPATEDFCKVSMSLRIDEGNFGEVPLGGITFAVIIETPPVMAEGNWKLGLVVDDSASDEQVEAVAAIASGQAGGPMESMGGLVSDFRGIERAPIEFTVDGHSRTLKAANLIDQEIEGVPSVSAEGDCIAIDNTFHPANKRLNLALAKRNNLHGFGIDWDDVSGKRNGHFAPFHWRS